MERKDFRLLHLGSLFRVERLHAAPINNFSKFTASHPHEVASRQGLDVAGDCWGNERTPKFFR
jgi:hypothetical protein